MESFFTFPDRALKYDCPSCGSFCCKGNGVALEAREEVVRHPRLEPRRRRWSIPSARASRRCSTSTMAAGCCGEGPTFFGRGTVQLPEGAQELGWAKHEQWVRDAIDAHLEEPDYPAFAALQEEGAAALADGQPLPEPHAEPVLSRAAASPSTSTPRSRPSRASCSKAAGRWPKRRSRRSRPSPCTCARGR